MCGKEVQKTSIFIESVFYEEIDARGYFERWHSDFDQNSHFCLKVWVHFRNTGS